MKILALDISTVATGWAIFEQEIGGGKLLDCGVIKIHESLGQSAKGYYVSECVRALIGTFRPNELVLEDTFFLKNALTLKVLCKIAGQVQHVWYELSGKEAHFYMPMTARKTFPGLKGSAEKEEIVEAVNKEFFSRKKEKNKLTDNNTADAIVLGHHFMKTNGAPDPDADTEDSDDSRKPEVKPATDASFGAISESVTFTDMFDEKKQKKGKKP